MTITRNIANRDVDPWDVSRRVVAVRMAPGLVASLGISTRPGESLIIDGVPNDAEFCGMAYDPQRDCFLFRYRHPSFAVVPDCDVIPEHDVLFTIHIDMPYAAEAV